MTSEVTLVGRGAELRDEMAVEDFSEESKEEKRLFVRSIKKFIQEHIVKSAKAGRQ